MSKPKKPLRIGRTSDKQYIARLYARNGQLLFWSESYKDRDSAVNAIDAVAELFTDIPTEEQLAQFYIDNVGLSPADLARLYLTTFRTVRDQLGEFIGKDEKQ